jgi:hypothetical protein
MNEVPDLNAGQRGMVERLFRWLLSRRIMRRVLVGVGLAITLIAVFYTKANRRGDRLWEECKREMTAKGEVLAWSAYVPGPVPDEQNIFKAPGMAEWFGDHRSIATAPLDHPVTNDFARKLLSANPSAEIVTATAAADYLARTEEFQADFDKIATALKRPYARIVPDYSQPLSMQFPNSVTGGAVVRTVEQRAKCHLLVGETEKAWQDLTLLWDLRRLVECQGKFITTEGAWMVRGCTAHALAVLAKGVQTHAWSEPQLLALQGRLKDTDLIAQFADAGRCGRALLLSAFESGALFKAQIAGGGIKERTMAILVRLAPRGEIYESASNKMRDWQRMIEVLDSTNGVVPPDEATAAFARWKRAQEGLPGLLRSQTLVNEGQIACALERYRLAHGEYPETLEVLAPQFIERLPHDIINGQPLKYRRMEGRGFLLYSVGWNGIDDGGRAVSNPERPENIKSGDWVWETGQGARNGVMD